RQFQVIYSPGAETDERGSHERRDDGDHDDNRVHGKGHDSQREPEGGDHQFHRTPGIASATYGERLPPREPAGARPQVPSQDLRTTREADRGQREGDGRTP